MDNINILMANKTEYINELNSKIKPLFVQGFQSIYNNVKEKCKNKKLLLRDFQDALTQIPIWNQEIIDNEHQRFIKSTECTWLDDLIKASFITSAQILLTNNSINKENKFDLVVPKTNVFIHRCYINIARELWKQPKLLYHNYKNSEIQKNLIDFENIIGKMILETIRKELPFKSVLNSFLDKNITNNLSENNHQNINNKQHIKEETNNNDEQNINDNNEQNMNDVEQEINNQYTDDEDSENEDEAVEQEIKNEQNIDNDVEMIDETNNTQYIDNTEMNQDDVSEDNVSEDEEMNVEDGEQINENLKMIKSDNVLEIINEDEIIDFKLVNENVKKEIHINDNKKFKENNSENEIENDLDNELENNSENELENNSDNEIENNLDNELENNSDNEIENNSEDELDNKKENKIKMNNEKIANILGINMDYKDFKNDIKRRQLKKYLLLRK